jgi:hypothetical protein
MKPPTGMTAVNENIQSNVLIDVYCEAYVKRYGGKPVFPTDNSHIFKFSEVQNLFRARALDVVRHYLKMNDEWFVRRGHAIEELIRNKDGVNADFSKHHSITGNNDGLRIDVSISCDRCFKYFKLNTTAHHLNSGLPRLCGECNGS